MRIYIKAGAYFLVLAMALALGVARGPASLKAADHLDGPGLTSPGGDSRLDINDVYAFRSAANSRNAVMIMTVNPAAGALSGQKGFSANGLYQFRIDYNGDAETDATVTFNFARANAKGVQNWTVRGSGRLSGLSASGHTGNTTNLPGGGKVKAGVFDDPFFFDLNNFLAVDFSCSDPGNFFKGLNTNAIVLELPRTRLGDDKVGVWARTLLNGNPIDRMGRPAINTVFIPANIFEPGEPSRRNAFNATHPLNDRRKWTDEVTDTLELFQTPAEAAALAKVLLPDILTVDFSSSAGFLNGRRLADDVIDAELNLVTKGAVTTDCVANDSAFKSSFPYLAPAS
ncbi:MAG TPA: DUF4331 family protein [Acidimicrobiia bacterium]